MGEKSSSGIGGKSSPSRFKKISEDFDLTEATRVGVWTVELGRVDRSVSESVGLRVYLCIYMRVFLFVYLSACLAVISLCTVAVNIPAFPLFSCRSSRSATGDAQ